MTPESRELPWKVSISLAETQVQWPAFIWEVAGPVCVTFLVCWRRGILWAAPALGDWRGTDESLARLWALPAAGDAVEEETDLWKAVKRSQQEWPERKMSCVHAGWGHLIRRKYFEVAWYCWLLWEELCSWIIPSIAVTSGRLWRKWASKLWLHHPALISSYRGI